MGELAEELAEEIKKGAKLTKPDEEELKKLEQAKKERLKKIQEEAERIKAELRAKGIDPDAEEE